MHHRDSANFQRLSSGLAAQLFGKYLWLALLTATAVGAEIKPAADTPQPVSPQESLKRFKLATGFRIELVASEPMLADPVAMTFDERGRLFVCEIYGYNLEGHYDVMELNQTGELDTKVRRILAPKEILERAERESHGSVKLLEDTNGDGQMDRMTVWATNLPPCYGLVAARQGVVVLCAPGIVYLADRDGDGRPEVREILFTGFGVGEMWTRISNPQWGVDNWIYAASGGESAGTIRGPHLARPVQLGNSCFRFKPDGTAFEPISGGTGGFGLALTDEDDRFLVSNQQHALYVAPLPHRYLARNPYYAGPRVVNNICAYGHPAKVFPDAPPDPWRLKRSQLPEWVKFYGAAETDMGLVTAACAPHIYRGDQFPPEYRGMHFSCECAYNLIHLCRLESDGAGYKAVRAIENGEFLTSSEQWFRPVNLAGGPDGALYVVDMYREIIEDYSAIPRYLQQQYGLIAGWDRGRIWRVVYDPVGNAGAPLRTVARWDLDRLKSTGALTSELSSSNAWRRLTAQRLLVERGDRSVVPELQRLLEKGATPSARLHSLNTLAGLKALEPATLVAALADASPGLRRHALQLSEEWLDRQPALLAKVLAMTTDPDSKVRIQLAFTLGETRDVRRLAALATLASQFGDDRWMQAAIVSSVPDAAEALLQELIKPPGLTDAGRPLAPALAGVIGARQQPSEIARLLQLLANYAGRGAESFQTACLASLNESLKRGKPPLLTDPAELDALRQLLASPSSTVRRLGLQLAGTLNLAQSPELISVFEQAAQAALNSELPLPDRQSAIALLASAPFAVLRKAATNLLAASRPLDIQLAAVNALSASDDTGVVAVLLSGWRTYSPKMQTAVLDAMFKRQDRIKAFLLAIQESTIPRPGLDPLRQNLLRTNPDAEIRRLAEPILARQRQAPGVDRQALLARYQTALSAPRHAPKGKELFQVHCSACHLLEGVGKSTGPELIAATKGRADETILLDILQPSDQITVGFRTYNVVTTSGHNLSGILAAETATSVTLPDEDGFPQTVLRKDIVSLQASDVSLMPANFDELLKPQDIADLLGYLRHLAGPPPGPVMTLFDDNPTFVEQLKEGDGTASIVTNQPHHGAAALMITPPQRFSPVIPGWQFRIVEKPGPGEYRYLRFAWKSPAGSGLMLELADQGQWPPPDKPLRRYFAGQNTTGWQARQQAVDPPREWTEVVVDLWKDFGPFTLTGLAPTAMGGPAYFDQIELLREMSDSPVTFPKQGALPARYPPDLKEQGEPAEKDYYIFSSPCRSLAQIAAIQKAMPPGQFPPPPPGWKHLQRTRRILTEGGELRLLALGDSIVNDTMRSGWVAQLQEAYPKARVQARVYVRGGGGCQHYMEEDRVAKYILPRKPNLVFIGGISQKDIESIREVIRHLRDGLPDVEILLATGTFGTVDPRDPDALAQAPYSGTGNYGRVLKSLAAEQRCAYLDMTTPWADYLRSAKVHPHLFYRDPVHANEFGEQVLAKIMMAFWTARQTVPEHAVLRVAYFIPADREPAPDHLARLDRVLSEVQRFYREGMDQNGYGPMTFELDRTPNGQLRVFEVRGKEAMRAYGRDDSGKVRDEVKTALARQGIDVDQETIIIFQLLLEWKGEKAIEIGPYVGGGDAHSGTAWVYDDAKLDPRLLASKEPGGYYHRPCSLGQFNTHYIGGVVHELGHALGLPHERERPSNQKSRGTSLMGSGNHTYGQELRGEGRGTFLTAAAAMPLSVHPLFTGKRHPRADLDCHIIEMDAKAEARRLTLTGKLGGSTNVVGMVAYCDPQDTPGDYDASGWTSVLDPDGRFRFAIEDLSPGVHDLRLRAMSPGGETEYFPFIFEVDAAGRPLVEPLLEGPWIQRAYEAFQSGDEKLLATIVSEAKQKFPGASSLLRKLAHYEKLTSIGQPQSLRSVSPAVKSISLADVEWESATTGWGPALRNQVSPNGDASGLLEVGGKFFESGLYAHAPARHAVRLNKGWKTFSTGYALQDRHEGSVVFVVKANGKELFRSGKISDHRFREQTVSVEGVALLELIVEDAGDGGNSDWGVWLNPQLRR